jgi:hypothetical protein
MVLACWVQLGCNYLSILRCAAIEVLFTLPAYLPTYLYYLLTMQRL